MLLKLRESNYALKNHDKYGLAADQASQKPVFFYLIIKTTEK